MTEDRLTTADRSDHTALRPVVRVGVGLVGMVVLLSLALLVHGVDRGLLEGCVTLGDPLIAAGTLGIVAPPRYAALHVRSLLSARLERPAVVVSSAATIGASLVDFVAVLFAYPGLRRVVVPLTGSPRLYDIALVAIALGLLGMLAYR